jgi:glycosyltransferase involved in cell wall biosynthesis
VPVVGTEVGGLTDTLAAGRGLLVPPEDVAALASGLERALADNHPAPEPGRRYAAGFSIGRMASWHAALYRQLLFERSDSLVMTR